jgi:predicted membrane protein
MRTLLKLFGIAWLLACVGALIGALTARRRMDVVDDADANEIALLASFGPLEFASTASRFRRGTIECWYGGGTVDLRGATLDPAGAHLAVRAIFGGGQIVVPPSWPVTIHVVGLGGIGDARPKHAVDPAAPALTIDGVCLFGGFGITSEGPNEALRVLV